MSTEESTVVADGNFAVEIVGVVWDKIHNSWVVNYTLLGTSFIFNGS